MMDPKKHIKRFEQGILVLDGAMGTMLQSHGIEAGGCPENMNLSQPDLIKGIHRSYVDAGSNIILSNTFGANSVKLAEYGLEGKSREINKAGVALVKEAGGKDTLAACSIGPTGKFIEPIGDLSFDTACDVYKEQIAACIDAGADIIALESFSDIKEIRAALIAANEIAGDLPVFAMMTFQDDCRTVLGTSPESAAVVLTGLNADFIGANCSLGPDLLLKIIKRMAGISSRPLIVQPNAGMPELKDNVTVFPATPDYMAEYAERFIKEGVRIIGGCCGTTPEHIKKIADAVKDIKPGAHMFSQKGTFVSNRTDVVRLGNNSVTKIIGERINPTGKSHLTDELKEGRVSTVIEMANSQVNDGADILDINVGASDVDECSAMENVVTAVQRSVNVPLMLDSQNPLVLEAGLKAADGKVIVNSVSGEKDKLQAILPLVKKYGAAVLGLTLDEDGIPKTAEKRVEIAERIISAAEQHGIKKEDVLIDCLSLAVSAEQDQAGQTLQAITIIKERYNAGTILGVSNISFGMPQRGLLNAAFLAMAVEAGLDAAIINPSDGLVRQILYAADLLGGRDKRAERYLKKAGAAFAAKGVEGPVNDDSIKGRIFQGVIRGDKDNIISIIETALNEKFDPVLISRDILIPALKQVGDLFEKKIYFLPQMILSAETMQKAFDRLKREFDAADGALVKGKIVMATVKGDIHDIGKNIAITLLKNYGYDVIDMGKSVAAEDIIDCAVKNEADIIGLSALMTTTMREMENIIKLMRKDNISIPVIIGGAVITTKYASEIGATAYAKDALDAVKKADELVEMQNDK